MATDYKIVDGRVLPVSGTTTTMYMYMYMYSTAYSLYMYGEYMYL